MSAHSEGTHDSHDHAADDSDGAADDHDDHGAEPALPEPESPAWLPLLGGALFLLALLGFLFTHSEEAEAKKGDQPAPEQAKQAQAAAAPTAPANNAANPPSGANLAPRLRQMLPGAAPRPLGQPNAPASAPNRANPPTFGDARRPAPGAAPQPKP